MNHNGICSFSFTTTTTTTTTTAAAAAATTTTTTTTNKKNLKISSMIQGELVHVVCVGVFLYHAVLYTDSAFVASTLICFLPQHFNFLLQCNYSFS